MRPLHAAPFELPKARGLAAANLQRKEAGSAGQRRPTSPGLCVRDAFTHDETKKKKNDGRPNVMDCFVRIKIETGPIESNYMFL